MSLQAERRARREGGGCGCGSASDGGRSCALGDDAHMLPAPAQLLAEAAAPMLRWPPALTQLPFFMYHGPQSHDVGTFSPTVSTFS